MSSALDYSLAAKDERPTASAAGPLPTPGAEGMRRYPHPGHPGYYFDGDEVLHPCLCSSGCPDVCAGGCGCQACLVSIDDEA